MKRLLLLTALIATPAFAEAPVSFTRDLAPILKLQCATCHATGDEGGDIALYPKAAYRHLVGVKSPTAGLVRVVPGKPNDSYLIMKLEGTHLAKGGKGVRMPFGGAPLPAATIALFRNWISQGAKNN